MRTRHSAQIRLASREDPPFSGKKISGSWSRHRARSCHGTKWCTASPRNYILVILDQLVAEKQVRWDNFPEGPPLVHFMKSWRAGATHASRGCHFSHCKAT